MVHKPDGQRPASGEQVQGPIKKRPDIYSLRRKINQLNCRLDDAGFPPPFMDQFPGKRAPFAYSKRYGPAAITVARRNGSTGFEGLCTVATPDQYLLPLNANINVAPNTDFWLCGISVYANYSLTYESGSGLTVREFTNGKDIFDPVEQNGGAIALTTFEDPRCSVAMEINETGVLQGLGLDLDLYDRNRGGKLTEIPTPLVQFSGQASVNKEQGAMAVLEGGTEIEPRLYVRAVNALTAAASDAMLTEVIFKAWFSVVFHGYVEIQ